MEHFVAIDAFLSVISFFMLLCGGALLFAAWPQRIFKLSVVEGLALTLGGLMVLVSGYGLAMVLA